MNIQLHVTEYSSPVDVVTQTVLFGFKLFQFCFVRKNCIENGEIEKKGNFLYMQLFKEIELICEMTSVYHKVVEMTTCDLKH